MSQIERIIAHFQKKVINAKPKWIESGGPEEHLKFWIKSYTKDWVGRVAWDSVEESWGFSLVKNEVIRSREEGFKTPQEAMRSADKEIEDKLFWANTQSNSSVDPDIDVTLDLLDELLSILQELHKSKKLKNFPQVPGLAEEINSFAIELAGEYNILWKSIGPII